MPPDQDPKPSTDPAFAETSPGDSSRQDDGRRATAPTSPPERVGRYTIKARLPWPGPATTYLAHDPELARDVTVRVLDHGHAGAEALGVVAQIAHPGLAPLIDIGREQDQSFVVTPVTASSPLPEWLRARPSRWREVLAMLLTVGHALVATQQAGLAHAELSATSVVVDAHGKAVIADVERFVSAPAGSPRGVEMTRAYGQLALESLGPAAPAWLRGRLSQSAAPDSSSSAASLVTLIEDIQRRLARPRTLAIGAGAALVVAAAAAVALLRPTTSAGAACQDPRPRLAGIWDDTVRARIRTVFTAASVPYAADALTRIIPALDEYATGWRRMHVEACRATRVDQRQTADLLDRRMFCLERRLGELRARTHAFADADATVVRRAVDTVTGLPPLAECADEKALLASQPLPGTASERARITRIYDEIDELRAFGLRAPPKEFLERVTGLVERTKNESFLPLRTRILRLQVEVQLSNKSPVERTLRELAETAARAHDDGAASEAWSRLVFTMAVQGRVDEARQLATAAEAATSRAGSPAFLVHHLESALGVVAAQDGDFERAASHQRAAVDSAPTPWMKRSALENLATTLSIQGQHAEALKVADEALALVANAQGHSHPTYADTLLVIGRVAPKSGRAEDISRAMQAYSEAIALYERLLGPETDAAANARVSMAELLRAVGRTAEAEREFRRAAQIYEKTKNTFMLPGALKGVADTAAELRGLREALPLYDKAIAAASSSDGADSVTVAAIEVNLAFELVAGEECSSALPYAQHALKAFELARLPGSANALSVIGECQYATGDRRAAFASLERAIEICSNASCMTGNLDAFRHQLGTKLVESGHDHARGIELVRQARAGFAETGRTDDVAEVDVWLKKHAR